MILTKRVYEAAEPGDGSRFLVDRLWPRGMRKESMLLDGCLKDLARSDNLRRWFQHDPAKWADFERRYSAEVDAKPAAWKPILDAARHRGVTLVYSARDTKHTARWLSNGISRAS